MDIWDDVHCPEDPIEAKRWCKRKIAEIQEYHVRLMRAEAKPFTDRLILLELAHPEPIVIPAHLFLKKDN